MAKNKWKWITLFASVLLFCCFFGINAIATSTFAQESETFAYLHYIDADGNEYGGTDQDGVAAEKAEIGGEGTYTVSLDFSDTVNGRWSGIEYLSLEIANAGDTFAGYCIRIWNVTVNKTALDIENKAFTVDQGDTIASVLYNQTPVEYVNSRSYDGNISNVTDVLFTEDQVTVNFRRVTTISVEFSFVQAEHSADFAYLMFCDNNFTYSYNTLPDVAVDNMESSYSYILGPGQYSVGLQFTGKEDFRPDTIKFLSLNILDGSETFPSYKIKVNSLKINGHEIELGKGYTCDAVTTDADNVESRNGTRYYFFHGWLEEVETTGAPRTWEDDMEGASPRNIVYDDFISCTGTGGDAYLQTVEKINDIVVDFEFIETAGEPVEAYVEFADEELEVVYFGESGSYNTEGIVSTGVTIDRAKRYSVSLDFTNTEKTYAQGLSSLGVVVVNGEREYEGYTIKILRLVINDSLVITSDQMTKGVTYPYGNADDLESTYDIRYDLYTNF